MSAASDDEPVPKLPRGRGLKLSGPEMFRIALTLAMLIAVIFLSRPCANAVSNFVTGFGSGSNAGSAMPKPGNVDEPKLPEGVNLKGMTPEQQQAAIEAELARARAAHGSAAGTGSATGSGTGASAGSAATGSGGIGSAATKP